MDSRLLKNSCYYTYADAIDSPNLTFYSHWRCSFVRSLTSSLWRYSPTNHRHPCTSSSRITWITSSDIDGSPGPLSSYAHGHRGKLMCMLLFSLEWIIGPNRLGIKSQLSDTPHVTSQSNLVMVSCSARPTADEPNIVWNISKTGLEIF